jgi:hypothetical protein
VTPESAGDRRELQKISPRDFHVSARCLGTTHLVAALRLLRDDVGLEVGIFRRVSRQHVRAQRRHAPLHPDADVPQPRLRRAVVRVVDHRFLLDVGEETPAEELVAAAALGVAVGAGVRALSDRAVEQLLPALDRRLHVRILQRQLVRHVVRLHLDQDRHREVLLALGGHLVAGRVRRVHGQEILDRHHPPVLVEPLRIARRPRRPST